MIRTSSGKIISKAKSGLRYLKIKKPPTTPISNLSAKGSNTIPQSVILFLVRAIAPSIASESAEIKNKIKAILL